MTTSPEAPAAGQAGKPLDKGAPSRKDSSAAGPAEPRKETKRDTFESIVFAFILAFLFRTFVAEAFVIPTGSMAPTLYGRHKEADCSQCGMHIVVGASDEYEPDAGVLKPNHRLTSAICPNCRFENKQLKEALAFNGDRILVNKFPFDIGPPRRWDVFVFKFPEKPDMNYIKRLVGLPGETIRIRQGDLYLWDGRSETMLRKDDPNKQRTLQIPVYDDAHPPTALLAAGWPERWASVSPDAAEPTGWAPADGGWLHVPTERLFRIDAAPEQELAWLRYRHFVPDPEDWNRLAAGKPLQPRAELISDFCGYNAVAGKGESFEDHDVRSCDLGAFWVGDLTLNCTIDLGPMKDEAEVVFELCEGVYAYRCRINPRSGAGRLFEFKQHNPEAETPLTDEVATPLAGPGEHRISFANVDDRICLWIDDQLVDFGKPVIQERFGATGLSLPQPSDLSPVGVAVRGVNAVVHGLKVERDVYYRAYHPQSRSLEEELSQRVDSPVDWARYYQAHAEADQQELNVDGDGFLAMGDNSPRSQDSRLWGHGMQTVPRRHLVGRAFYVYWPHGVPFLNGGRGYPVRDHVTPNEKGVLESVDDYPKYTAPFYPQFERMKRIR